MILLVVPSDLSSHAIVTLFKHGCGIDLSRDRCIVALPDGSTRSEVFPRVVSMRYKIVFPDGYEVWERYDRLQEKSFLYL